MIALALLPLIFSSSRAAGANWQIDRNGGLYWKGSLYNPVGLSISGNSPLLQQAVTDGVKNFCVNLSFTGLNWNDALKPLQASNSQFVVDIASSAAPGFGYTIDPAAYRIGAITQDTSLDLSVPGTKSALVVFATLRDAEIEFHKVIPVTDGHLKVDLHPLNDLDHVLLVYPLQESMALPDLFEGMDKDRDALLSQLYSLHNTSGLRAVIDPLGQMPAGISPESRFVPASPLFQSQFANYLKRKYQSLKFVALAWGMMMSDQVTYMDFARLVPLWEGNSGAQDLFDPKTGVLYQVQRSSSQFWRDLREMLNAVAQARFQNISNTIHTILNVPVLQTWNGWAVPYEGAPAVDGVATSVSGTSHLSILDSVANSASSLSRWSSAGWLCAPNWQVGSTDTSQFSGALSDLSSLNTQGVFLSTDSDAQLKLYEGWIRSASLEQPHSLSVLYYPSTCRNPAFPQLIGGGRWWLPAPISGGRLNLGPNLQGYRMEDNIGPAEVIWAKHQDLNENLLFAQPKAVTIESVGAVSPDLKLDKGGIKLNISTLPLVIRGTTETPAPASGIAELAKQYAVLSKLPEFGHANIDATVFDYHDALKSLVRSPGPAYEKLQSSVRNLTFALGNYYFFNGSQPQEQNFGRSEKDASSITGNVWRVRSVFPQLSGAFSIKYAIPLLYSKPVHIWVALSGAPEDIAKVSLVYNGQAQHPVQASGITPYGSGYSWYDFGQFQLLVGQPELELQVKNDSSVDVAIDSFMVAPEGILPDGPDWRTNSN